MNKLNNYKFIYSIHIIHYFVVIYKYNLLIISVVPTAYKTFETSLTVFLSSVKVHNVFSCSFNIRFHKNSGVSKIPALV